MKYVKPEVLAVEFAYENIASGTGGDIEIPDLPPLPGGDSLTGQNM